MPNDAKDKSGEAYPFNSPNAAIEGGKSASDTKGPPPPYSKTAFQPPPKHPARDQYFKREKPLKKKEPSWKSFPRALKAAWRAHQ